MTIREHFQRIQKTFKIALIVVAFAVLIPTFFLWPKAPAMYYMVGGLVFATVSMAVMVPIMSRIYRCPRCDSSYRKMRIDQRGRFNSDSRLYWDLWEACPHCGLSFNEQWQGRAH